MSSKSEDVRPRAALCTSAAQSSVDKWWFTQKRWFIRKDNKDETSELQIQHRLKKRASSECVHSREARFYLTPYIEGDDAAVCWKPGRQTFLFENGVKSKVGGCIGTACKSLKTVQAKQCSPPRLQQKWKAPYFLRSTVLFWWRIAGSNRWPLACHASALLNHALTHPHIKLRGWTIFDVKTLKSKKSLLYPLWRGYCDSNA